MKMMIHILLFLLGLFSYAFSQGIVNDFCVADLKLPSTPSGYPCKSPANVTVDDFVFSGYVAAKARKPFNVGFTTAFVNNFPGVNGLGISVSRADMDKGGSVPMHTHPGVSELIIVVQGQVTAGFMTSNAAYVKTLKPGDLMVFPQGQVHFQVNTGEGKATLFAAFSSANPGVQTLDFVLFNNSMPSQLIAQSTLMDVSEIKKLKALFGGSG
ncbi:RmlC-like cupin domain superfamily [Sesbania bispinosa]|nr:RmlC-like cupin domain superfamily [Sesbania bispinosa]